MMKTKLLIKYLTLIVSIVIFSELTNKFLDFDNLIYDSLAQKLTTKQLHTYFKYQDNWKFISYLIIPILILFKSITISTLLYIGLFLNSYTTIAFYRLWILVLNSEFIFLIIPVLKIIWFYFFQINYTLEDIQYFYPLSVLNIIGYKGLESWLIYPLQTLNVFELAYIIILSYQIGTVTKTNADTGLKIVASSYLPALLLWVTVVMFFTLNFS